MRHAVRVPGEAGLMLPGYGTRSAGQGVQSCGDGRPAEVLDLVAEVAGLLRVPENRRGKLTADEPQPGGQRDQPLASRAPDPTTGGAPGAAGQAEGQVETGGVRWDLGPRYMLRVAGLPFDAVDTQRAPRSLEWADAVLDGERELSAAGAGLSELLHAAIATLDEQGRRVVLAVRRGVFKNKPPADPDEALRLLAAQPAAHAALADWLAARARWERLREQGPGLLQLSRTGG